MNETNPTQPPTGAITETQAQALEESAQPEVPTAKSFWKAILKWLIEAVGFAVGLLWLVALVDSYRPKISITVGGTFNPVDPLKTVFIVENESLLPIHNVNYTMSWQEPPHEGTNVTVISQDVTVIEELKPLECHSLMAGNGGVTPKEAVACKFDVTYEPMFFGHRTDTLFFWAQKDIAGNWLWFPSGHHIIWFPKYINKPLPKVNTNAFHGGPPGL